MPEKILLPEIEKSKGHVCFYQYEQNKYELYLDAKGNLYRAPVGNVIDIDTGYRMGRFEAPSHLAQQQIKRLTSE